MCTNEGMEYLVNPDSYVKEEEFREESELLEIDPGLLLRKDHLSWLFHLINSIPQTPCESVHFCISCGRFLMMEEEPMLHMHQPFQGPHHLLPLIRVPGMDYGMADNYYVRVELLDEIQVPIGDVLSHALPHPPRHGLNGVPQKARCMYVRPQTTLKEKSRGVVLSGKCAYRHCERVFHNRQSHLKVYGITPQFCSISCKLNTWLCCNK